MPKAVDTVALDSDGVLHEHAVPSEFLRSLARTLCLTPKDDDFYLVNEAWIAACEKYEIGDDQEQDLLRQAEEMLLSEGFKTT